MMDKLISQQAAINAVSEITTTMSVCTNKDECYGMKRMQKQAITELENLPSVEPEAISKWKKEFREYVDSLDITRDDWKGIIEYIDELPSAEPDTTTHDSIPAETGKNDEDRTSGDCISRQQAIEVLRNRWLKTRNYDGIGEDIAEECEIYLKTLPSAQSDIIRCKDCKHSRFFDPCFYCYEMGGEIIVPENGFCFKAERREE